MKTLIKQFKKIYNSVLIGFKNLFIPNQVRPEYQYKEKTSREQYEQELDKIFDFSSVKTIPLNEIEPQDDTLNTNFQDLSSQMRGYSEEMHSEEL